MKLNRNYTLMKNILILSGILVSVLFFLINSNLESESFIAKIIIEDHKFIPSELIVPSDKNIKLIIHNKDNFVEEFESHDLKREKIVPAGGTISIMLAPLVPGKYYFFGDFHPDTAKGYLIVK